MAEVQIQSVRPWHETLLEFIIANPRASGAETAMHFGVTEAWLSTVKNSDAFQEMWAMRRGEHFSRVSASLVEKVTALAEVTVDALVDQVEMEKRTGQVSLSTLTEVGNMALKSLGFGAKPTPSVQVNSYSNSTNVFIDKETLARAREARARLQETLPQSPSSVRVVEYNEANEIIEEGQAEE